jgi:hypothetical protein
MPTRRRLQQQMARTRSGWVALVVGEAVTRGDSKVEGFLDFILWLVYEGGLNFCKLAA